MFGAFRTLLRTRKTRTSQRTSRHSREEKPARRADPTETPPVSSRDRTIPYPGVVGFEGFRYMLKDLSRRIEAIRENPEETYLINTEATLRLLGILENLSLLTEKNTITLEKLSGQGTANQHEQDDSGKKRRAREVLRALERCGELTYEELRRELKPQVSYNRVTALVSEMIRDGVPLTREGRPVRVSLAEPLTGSN